MFEINDTAILDKGQCDEVLVIIKKFYKNNYCKVKRADGDGDSFKVHILRLSKS